MFEASGGNPDIDELSTRLGVVPRTLTRQIARLRLTDKYDSLLPKKLGKARMSFKDIERKRQTYRKIWIKTRLKKPNFSRTDLRKTIEPVFSWLYKHDPQWLMDNMPEKKKYQLKHQYVDWEKRDKEAAERIPLMAAEFKAQSGKPVFVSRTLLIKKLKLANNVKHPKKIPLTMLALDNYSETHEEYSFRRIDWGVQECLKLGRLMGRYSFAEMLGLAPRFLIRYPSINKKLDEAMEAIKS